MRGPGGCSTPEAAEDFVAAYRSVTGETLHPFWVMASHLEHSHDYWTEERLALDEPDLTNAVRSISE